MELSRQCKYFLVYLFVTNNVNPFKMGRVILFALMLGLIFESGFTLVMYKFGKTSSLFGSSFGSFEGGVQDNLKVILGDKTSVKRAVGTFRHPMILAKYFELVLPLAFLFFWISRDNKRRLFFCHFSSRDLFAFISPILEAAWWDFYLGFPLCSSCVTIED